MPQGPPPTIQVNPANHPDNQTLEQRIAAATGPLLSHVGGSDGPDNATSAQALAAAEKAIHAFIQLEGDAQDKQVALKALTMLQSISAGHAKEKQAALGGGPATNFIRRTVGG